MFSLLSEDPKNALVRDRLMRLLDEIRSLKLSTREEYQAEVFSRVNRVLGLGNSMQALAAITAEGPAVVGDLTLNLLRLNQDATDIAGEILHIEDSAAQLYNLAVASQNSLRQQIRERLYASDSRRFIEAFIYDRNLSDVGATIDFNAGVASLPLVEETELKPDISVGPNSDGNIVVGTDALLDGNIETALVFNGTKLELTLSFSSPEIINRLRLELDDYEGLEVTAFTSSPDGTLVEDVLADMAVPSIAINGTYGKYSGDVILDFPPRHAKRVKLVIEDRVGSARIALRSLSVFRRSYQASGELVSKPISSPSGSCVLSVDDLVEDGLTQVTLQVSDDGVHFSNVVPGVVTLPSPFWFKALFERSNRAFEQQQVPLDPAPASVYGLRRSSAVPLGAAVIERTLVLENVNGPVRFRETPLPKSLSVQEGAALLGAGDYAFNEGVLSFPVAKALVTVTYQTSAFGPAALATRKDYYTPLLYQVKFEKV